MPRRTVIDVTGLLFGDKEIMEIFSDAEVWEAVRQEMVETVTPVFRAAFIAGSELAAEEQASFTRDYTDDDVLPSFVAAEKTLPLDAARVNRVADNFIATYTDEWWGQFKRSTQNSMRRAIQTSVNDGTGSRGAAKLMTPLFGRQRAKLIAVSESTNLMGMGAHETYREAGYTEWEWRTARDSKVDITCQFRDKKKFPMSVQFQRAHPGCRCWPVPAGKPAGFGDLDIDTQKLHTNARGEWTAERRLLHDRIVQDIKRGATPVADDEVPAFHMMGGGPASGKSTVTKNIDLGFPTNRVSIDSDAIKDMLPEYRRMLAQGDQRAAAFAHEESSFITKRLVAETTQERYNVLLDGTGDSGYDKLVKKMAGYQAEGHQVIADYMSLDTDLAWKIANARAKATGRFVPESVVRETHATISEVLPRVAREGRFDRLRVWDTNIEGVPRLIADNLDDGVFKIRDEELWARFLSKADPSGGYAPASGRFTSLSDLPGYVPSGPMKQTSLNLNTNGRGVWTLERKKLHDRIIADIKRESGAKPVGPDEVPSFNMMGGGPASGKSTVSKNVDLGFPSNRLNIDADLIKTKLPEYDDLLARGDSNAAVFVHDESTFIQQRLAAEGIEQRYNIFLDGTGDNGYEHLTRQFADYRSRGLANLDANYMSLDTDLAVKIAKIREKATGRGVPESVIRDKHASISEVLPRMVDEGQFDRLRLWDTNIENVPRLIADYEDGVFTIYDEGLWARFLSKADSGAGYELANQRVTATEIAQHADEVNVISSALSQD